MRSASALTGDDVAGILVGSAGIAVAWFASIAILGESPILRQALIAVARCDIPFARALTGQHVATLIVNGTQGVTGAGLTSLGIIGIKVPKAVFAAVATAPVNVRFAMTASRLVAT